MIKKISGRYVVLSETTGTTSPRLRSARRKFGTYKTLAEAKRRLQQVEFFKHLSARQRRRR